MPKFSKKQGKSKPEVSTASLPDIIFMLLFFFMTVTVMRSAELKVKVNVPEATQLTKLEQKSLVHHIYVGRPMPNYIDIYGTSPRMQLGDKFATMDKIPLFIEQEKAKVPKQLRPRATTSLRVDGDVTMGIVQDVKTQLRKSDQLKINYSARRRAE